MNVVFPAAGAGRRLRRTHEGKRKRWRRDLPSLDPAGACGSKLSSASSRVGLRR
jgi:hypothetical protein